MCGINGFLQTANNDDSVLTTILDSMNQAIHHRGPDDAWTSILHEQAACIWLWQVRLSIIDLSAWGHQPMTYDKVLGASNEKTHIHETSTTSIVFNGEIYNYQDIKTELLQKWYIFTSKSDTEVILASYLEWWAECVQHFNGFRAFAIYDKEKKILFCSRDRLGVKPFYYFLGNNSFVFSSEIKGILQHPDLDISTPQNIDPEAVDFYLTTGFIPAPWTIYKNVKKLEAGHNITLSMNDKLITSDISRYYEIPPYKPTFDKQQLIDEWKQLLEDSVKIRMFTSDVPVWAFLSWWLDSSSVVAEMTKRVHTEKLNTFSIWFEGKYDETPYIDIVKKAFGTNHHHAYFEEKNFESLLDSISYYYDEPFGDYSNFPTMFVSDLARKNVTVSLSGDGWDEIFGGYMMHQVAAQMEIIRKVPKILRKFLYAIVPQTSNNLSILSKIKEALRVSLFDPASFYAEIGWSTIYKPAIYKQRTTEKLSYLLDKTGGDYTQAIIDFDLCYNTLADNFLVKVDRASMSYALEVRSPFLDRRWIERSRKVPTQWKVTWNKTKIIMREIIKDIVPDTIIHRNKKWFQPPIDKWILDPKYSIKLHNSLDKLSKIGIISPERYRFYASMVFTNNNSAYNTYKIRLLLLDKRHQRRFM
jgi:asparagine synthase (glutamine-hydrolysing)